MWYDEWIDQPGGYTSLRPDGAKIGGFFEGGKLEWWGYPPGYTYRGPIEPLGPFGSMDDAKIALEANNGKPQPREVE